MTRPLLVIVGPTCSGKTALAVAVAQRLAPAELVSADSRQVRSTLRVGTCAPTAAELDGVRCNLLDLCDPGDVFTVADWLAAARPCLERLERESALAVVVGGTGLYVTALVDGFDLAGVPPDPARRAARTELAVTPEGFEVLAAELRERDPAGAATIDQHNPRRVIRALEILDARGGSILNAHRQVAARDAVMVGLDVARPIHAQWVEHRVATMFESGGIQDEVSWMLRLRCGRQAITRCGIGYAEALDLVEGRIDIEGAKQAALRRTLRYARAQRTWFRRDTRLTWFRPDLVAFDQLVEGVAGMMATARA
ncbi:MAG: tRNA (adenosine(37)-N6)-dimethylallyltransferase MiaA [Candidatus Dormiibacterota bacterium]